MAIARVKTWIAGEVLTASDLNAEYNNIIDNALALVSPLTGALNFNNNQANNLRLERFSSVQATAAEGRIYYHTSEDSIHVDDGSGIRRVPTVAWPGAFATGYLLVSRATGFNFLAPGTNGQTLVADDAQTVGVRWGSSGADVIQVQLFS